MPDPTVPRFQGQGSLIRCLSGVAAGDVEPKRPRDALQLHGTDLDKGHRPALGRVTTSWLTTTSPGLAYSAILAARLLLHALQVR